MRLGNWIRAAATLPAFSVAVTEVFDNFTVEAFVDPDDFDYAIIMLRMPPNTWFGLGLGSRNMDPDSDMI